MTPVVVAPQDFQKPPGKAAWSSFEPVGRGLATVERRYVNFRIWRGGALGHACGMNWKSIRLELASTGEFPDGSVGRAYLLQLPLDDRDRVDRNAFAASPSKAIVRRHWGVEPDQRGRIEPLGSNWALRCDRNRPRVLHLGRIAVRLGQRVSVLEPDGSILPFRIASVR